MKAKNGNRAIAKQEPHAGRALSEAILLFALSSFILASCDPSPDKGGNESAISVRITSPSSAARFEEGSIIAISVEASTTEGSIQRVEYRVGSQLLGQNQEAPYVYSWTPSEPGSYSLTATAYSTAGDSAQSDEVAIEVTEPLVPSIYPILSSGRWVYVVRSHRSMTTNSGTDTDERDGAFELEYAGAESGTGAMTFTTSGYKTYEYAAIPDTLALSYGSSELSVRKGTEEAWATTLASPTLSGWDGAYVFVDAVREYTGSGNAALSSAVSSATWGGAELACFVVSSSFDNYSDPYQTERYDANASQTIVPGIGVIASSFSFEYDDYRDAFYLAHVEGSCSITLKGYALTYEDGSVASGGTVDLSTEPPTSAPGELAAETESGSAIALSWANYALNAARILIERKTTGAVLAENRVGLPTEFAQIASVPPGTTNYEDLNVIPAGFSYTYRIRASNGSGESAYSNESTSVIFSLPEEPSISYAYWGNEFDAFHHFLYRYIALNYENAADNADTLVVEWSPEAAGSWQALVTIEDPAAGESGVQIQGVDLGTFDVDLRAYTSNKWGNSGYSGIYTFGW